eukprot:410404_1
MMNEEEERTKASLPEDTKEYSKDDDEESKLPEEQRKEDPPETIKVTKKAKLSGVPSTVERVDSTPKPIPEAAATPDSDASPAHKTHVVIGEYDLSVPDDKVPLWNDGSIYHSTLCVLFESLDFWRGTLHRNREWIFRLVGNGCL